MQEDLEFDARTIRAPRRTRWYTRLWHACLGLGCICCKRRRRRRRRQEFPLNLIGYDPVGQFQRAASVGDVASLERFINGSEYHVNDCDRRGRTSLHYAAAHNHPDVVTLLVSSDFINIDLQDDEGCTPLIKAIQRDNVECVSILLMHGADPHIPDFNGNAALHHAVCRGNTTIAGRLLEYNVNIDAKTKYGLTPYKLALFERQQEMAEFLIRNGAHSELTPISGTTAAEASEQTMKESGSLNKEENFSTDSVPSCSHSAVRPPRKTKIIFKMSFLTNRASQRHKDQITLSEDTMAREPEQRKEKHVTFNTEVHYNTDKKPFCSGIRTPGEPKSILKKSIPINGDNTRNNDQLSLRLSINPDVPTSSTEDKASTSAIKEDTESTSSRYRSTQKQFFYYKMIAEKQKRDQEAFWKSVMDPRSLGEAMPEFGGKISCLMVENKREGFLPARHEHDIVPQPPAHADSTSSCHASDRGDNHQASEETSAHSATLEHTCSLGDAVDPPQKNVLASVPTDYTCYAGNTQSNFFPIWAATVTLLLLTSSVWFLKFVVLVITWVLSLI